ncbi:MAG: SDR family oxidoreductase [Chakrabartia sp.]
MKLALVTAGFHRLGAAIAARLAEDGWALALHSRRPDTPDPGLADVLARCETRWQPFVADLGDDTATSALLPDIVAQFGRAPDLLVNNASRFDWDDPHSLTSAALKDHFAVNAAAPILLATALLTHLAEGQRAAVVNILDQRIRHPGGDQLSYTISKMALSGATETLARALAPRVRVNAVAPGLVIPTDDYTPGQMAALRAAMPLARLPEPSDIADAVHWLAGADLVTGQTLFVDGGAALKSFERDFVFLGRDA